MAAAQRSSNRASRFGASLALCVSTAFVGALLATGGPDAHADTATLSADLAWAREAPVTAPPARAVSGMTLDHTGT